jgi:hypothetical protein
LKEWNTHPANRASKGQLHLVPARPLAAKSGSVFCGDSSPSQDVPTIHVQMSTPCLNSERPAMDTVSDRHCLSTLVHTSMQQSGSPSSFVPTAGPVARLGDMFVFHVPRCSSPVPNNTPFPVECEPSLTVPSLSRPGQLGPGSASPALRNHSPRTVGIDSPQVPCHPIHSCLTSCVARPASNAGIQARFPITAEDCEYRVMPPSCGQNGDDCWTVDQITGELYI